MNEKEKYMRAWLKCAKGHLIEARGFIKAARVVKDRFALEFSEEKLRDIIEEIERLQKEMYEQ